MQRRNFIGLLGLSGASVYGFNVLKKSEYWPDDNTFFNPCLNSQLPPILANHNVVRSAFADIDTTQIWDGHIHLIGIGDSASGIWVNPNSFNPFYLKKYVQFRFFLNASCPSPNMAIDEGFVNRLASLTWGTGVRFLLLAFDHSYNEKGERLLKQTPFYTPNDYAASIHRQYPHQFEWLASIHPYRKDCIEVLEKAVANQARGVKWLPPAMGIDPSSPLCDRFYKALVYWDIPLLCHGGDEQAIDGSHHQKLGNPLLLRRALDQGVKVVVAHCASLGQNRDLDKGTATLVSNFDLFTRLLDESAYKGQIFGDISAMTQIKRVKYLKKLLAHPDWHSQLLYASDYPLPAVIPITSLKLLHEQQLITAEQVNILSQLRQHNALLFDFVLARHIQVEGQHFPTSIFHTRPFWTGVKQLV
ncbi:MAG: amidohydrolase family protein [Thiomargarita sp.]|nr:amidohydrolase family protein [Thiomargarita sp.]